MAGTPVPIYLMLTKEAYEIQVDEDVFRMYHHLTWRMTSKAGYAVASIDGKEMPLHRLILGITDPKVLVDHKNGNRLDYRRENLRLATHKQNSQNRKVNYNSKFQWKGVQKLSGKRSKPYNARIMQDGQSMSLGVYKTPEEAARAYDRKAKELFGEFASLNFPEEV